MHVGLHDSDLIAPSVRVSYVYFTVIEITYLLTLNSVLIAYSLNKIKFHFNKVYND